MRRSGRQAGNRDSEPFKARTCRCHFFEHPLDYMMLLVVVVVVVSLLVGFVDDNGVVRRDEVKDQILRSFQWNDVVDVAPRMTSIHSIDNRKLGSRLIWKNRTNEWKHGIAAC